MKQTEALKLALEALKELVEKFDSEQFTSICELDPAKDAIAAAESALAQPEQEHDSEWEQRWPNAETPQPKEPEHEPVSWDGDCVLGHCGSPAGCEASNCCRADSTTPPQRKPLTLGQKQRLWSSLGNKPTLKDRVNAFGLAIEAAHGIKE